MKFLSPGSRQDTASSWRREREEGLQDRSRTERESTPCIMGPGKGVLFAACAEELGSQPPQGPLLSTALESLLLFVRWEGCPSLPAELCNQRATAQGCSLHGKWSPGYLEHWWCWEGNPSHPHAHPHPSRPALF